MAQADSAVCSGYAQECSFLAQVKAAAAHVQRLKQKRRKKKLSMTIVVVFRRGILQSVNG